MSTPADRILKPGDKIEWVAQAPHFLRLGAPGLTPRDQVEKILTFLPKLTLKPRDILEGDPDVVVTGTVTDNAAAQGVSAFVFACGQHPTAMLSSPFTIAA